MSFVFVFVYQVWEECVMLYRKSFLEFGDVCGLLPLNLFVWVVSLNVYISNKLVYIIYMYIYV